MTLALPLHDNVDDLTPVLDLIGDAPIVLIGEATHGTHEFYEMRARITKALIEKRGFRAVCIEGDWPDAYRVNRYVRGAPDDTEAVESLSGFTRFPAWMWRNAEVLDFVSWLREYNERQNGHGEKTGFYGLDLYSMYASIDAVIRYLDEHDPQLAARARERYACLERFDEGTAYAYGLLSGMQRSCRTEVISNLLEIQRNALRLTKVDGIAAEDEYFYAEHNARVVANAEHYYRTMLDEEISSWNMRDEHMAETLEHLTQHLARRSNECRAVVWAHNSHVGDARHTAMGRRGETNIGALLRGKYGGGVVSIGFTTYTGTVIAAHNWHEREERMKVRPALDDSYESLFHDLGKPRFFLELRPYRPRLAGLPPNLTERAIGVVYRPQTERASHYFRADLLHQFDAVYHFDTTRAVEPLERTRRWIYGEVPETYPSGA